MIVSLLTRNHDESKMMIDFRDYLKKQFKADVHNFVTTKDGYAQHWNDADDLITWGVKWHSEHYKRNDKNVLFLENCFLKQGTAISSNISGYFACSSIVKNKEYLLEPSSTEKKRLRAHIKRYYQHKFGEHAYDPKGPVLIPLQMNNDATMKHYFPMCDTDQRVYRHLELCIDNIPDSIDVMVRSHPKETKYFPEDMDLPQNFRIDNSDNIKSVLPKCSGVIAVNSTVALEALIFGLPVATLGRSVFTGSDCVLDCSDEPGLMCDIKEFKPDMNKIEKLLCAIMRHQIPYGTTLEQLLRFPAIKDWLKIVAKRENKRLVSADKSEIDAHDFYIKNKSKIVMHAPKKRKQAKKKEVIQFPVVNTLYHTAVISASRAGRMYLGTILGNHPQIDLMQVGIFELHSDYQPVLNDPKCTKILVYKEDVFENYISHYLYERCRGNWKALKNQRFTLDKHKAMHWMIETRERYNEIKEFMTECIPFLSLNEEKINDLFNKLNVTSLLSLDPNTKKCPVENRNELIRNYDTIKETIENTIGLSIHSELTAGNEKITHCRNCKNRTIDKACEFNRCLHCGQKNG